MNKLDKLEKEIQLIKNRNKKVESDKAWEVSWTRRILIATFTYVAIGLYLQAIKVDNSWLNSIVPTIGFYAFYCDFALVQEVVD
jgi:hypothetical protein